MVRPYKCLFALALINAIRDITFRIKLNYMDASYTHAWEMTLPILMFLQLGTALEAYDKLVAQYAGLGTFGYKLLRWSGALLSLMSCALIIWGSDHFTKTVYEAVIFAYRYFIFVLAGSVAIPYLLLRRLPRPAKKPPKNVTAHLCILVCYFITYLLGIVCTDLLGIHEPNTTVINVFLMLGFCGIYLAWAFALTRSGESSVPWPKMDSDSVAIIDARKATAIELRKRFSTKWRTTVVDGRKEP